MLFLEIINYYPIKLLVSNISITNIIINFSKFKCMQYFIKLKFSRYTAEIKFLLKIPNGSTYFN